LAAAARIFPSRARYILLDCSGLGVSALATDAPSLEGTEGEFASLLTDLGLEAKPARVLAFLAGRGRAKSTDLERACGLRQPEVSQATKKLREEYRWIIAEPQRAKGKGRPVNEYTLQVPLVDIIGELEARKRAQIDVDLARLEQLRQLASRLNP